MTVQNKNNNAITSPGAMEAVPSNLTEMNGKKREFERIRIEDLPGKLDRELNRIESNRNRLLERKLEVVAGAAMIAALVGVCLVLLGASTLGLGLVIVGSISSSISFIASAFVYPHRRTVETLRHCREDLQEKEFPAFVEAKKDLSEGLTLNEWLRLHALYEKKKDTDRKMNELIDQLHWNYC